MGLLDAIFGNSIVNQARNSQAVSTEVWAAFYRWNKRDNEYDVGVRHGANERMLILRSYRDEADAADAADALADHYDVGVES